MPATAPSPATPAFDLRRRYVRRRAVRADGFVEFEFAIGEPALYVELILPQAAFEEFCRAQQAIRLGDGPDDHHDPQETTP